MWAQVAEVARYAAEHGADLRTVELDVASSESVEAGIAKIVAETGRFDVVIHSAGHMSFGPAERLFGVGLSGSVHQAEPPMDQRPGRADEPNDQGRYR